MKKLITALAVTAVLGASVYAKPADAANNWTQKGFERHLSSVDWNDGSIMKFEQLHQCEATVNHHSRLRDAELKDRLQRQLDENEQAQMRMTDAMGNELTNGSDKYGNVSQRYYQLERERQALISHRYDVLMPAFVKASEDYVYWTTPDGYKCNGGWVTVSNPQGQKVCQLTQVAVDINNYTNVKWRNCRWK